MGKVALLYPGKRTESMDDPDRRGGVYLGQVRSYVEMENK